MKRRFMIRTVGAIALVCMTALMFVHGETAQTVAVTVTATRVNVRAGPGTTFPILTHASRGTVYTGVGRTQAADWIQICCVNQRNGWIYAALVSVEGSVAGLPVTTGSVPTPTPTPLPIISAWRGEYFANRDLQGAPVLVRDDPTINFQWSGGPPAPNLPGTNFSVRWTRTVAFPPGDTTFYAQTDDGVRLWLDNILIIDQWRESTMQTYSNTQRISAGNHVVRVEYFQASGNSAAVVWWEQAYGFPDWKGEYYEDIYLRGSPLLVRNDPNVTFNWGLGSPASQVPVDNFSVRWTRRVDFEGGDTAFFAQSSDGVRVYVDGWLVLDAWQDVDNGLPTFTGVFRNLEAGTHTVMVEYYERGGIALIYFWWEKIKKGGEPIQ